LKGDEELFDQAFFDVLTEGKDKEITGYLENLFTDIEKLVLMVNTNRKADKALNDLSVLAGLGVSVRKENVNSTIYEYDMSTVEGSFVDSPIEITKKVNAKEKNKAYPKSLSSRGIYVNDKGIPLFGFIKVDELGAINFMKAFEQGNTTTAPTNSARSAVSSSTSRATAPAAGEFDV
jgi:hypothetical protein